MSKAWIVLGMVLFLGIGTSFGQTDLTLADAIALGLKNNYDIAISESNIEIAENSNNQGEAGRWPTLQLGVDQRNSFTDNIKTASPFQPRGLLISNDLSPYLSVNWILFEGFKVNITKSRLEYLQQQSEGNASVVVANTVQAIILAYYLVSLESERLEVFGKSKKLSSDKYRYVKLKTSFGSAVTSDLLLEEGNYLTDSVNYVNQELSYRNAVRMLNNLMAVENVETDYVLSDTISVPVNSYSRDALYEKMIQDNVDLKVKYLAQSVVEYDRKTAQTSRYPRFSLSGNVNNNFGRVDQSQAQFFDQSTREFVPGPSEVITTSAINYGLTFNITYNLFNGRKINTAVKNAKVREDIGNLDIDKLKLNLKKDLFEATDQYDIRRTIHSINKRKLEAAVTNLNLTEEKFKLGAINSFDFRTVQLNYLNAALQELNSRYGLVESEISLMRLTGGILETYQ